MLLDYPKNYQTFAEVMDGNVFGRYKLITNVKKITSENIIAELQKALSVHEINRRAIVYLDRYYRGDQPILYRQKEVRAEINNKVVENHAFEIVESKVADLYGEPVQYVLRSSDDDKKSQQIIELNTKMDAENKASLDVERGRWASVCGTSYYYVGRETEYDDYDETPFYLVCENPADCFVVYYADNDRPAFSCQIRENEDGNEYYVCFTNTTRYEVIGGEIADKSINGMGYIPLIEYPNNERRLSDVEITITMTDEINKMQSDRMNGIEQFVQALMLFKNCEIDESTFLRMCKLGAINIKTTTSGYDADVKQLSGQLDQAQTQTAKDDVYNNLLIVQGKPSRQENSGGDTGQAVVLRNGYYDEDKRAELRIPVFKKSERQLLKVILNILRIYNNGSFDLKVSDIEIKPKRSKLENMMVKAQVLQILHQIGVDDGVAMKLVNLFSDVQEAYALSKDTMKAQFESAIGITENADSI